MSIVGAIYPEAIPKESATERMLMRSCQAPKIWRDGLIEMGSALPGAEQANLKDFIVLFDGSLYNQGELTTRLKAANDLSIEALIGSLYAIYQEECFSFLNGNFALAIYDKKQKELLLARDRLGEKGLFWFMKKRPVYFCNFPKDPASLPPNLAHPRS